MISLMARLVVAALIGLFGLFGLCAQCGALRALEFGSGALPIAFEPDAGVALPAAGRISIAGTIEGQSPVTIVLRIDDGRSTDYPSRMNDERTLPPGPFALSIDIGSLRTTGGRPLVTGDIRRVILFIVGSGNARVTQFATVDPAGTTPATGGAGGVAATTAVDGPAELNFGTGTLPIAHEPDAPFALGRNGRIVIAGMIDGPSPATVVLRIDDTMSSNYATRMNDERVLPAGPFNLSYAVDSLRAVDGRKLDTQRIARVILFVVGSGSARVTQFAAVPAATAATLPAPADVAIPTTTAAQPGGTGVSTARDFGTGRLPIRFEPGSPTVFADADEIHVEGIVNGTVPAAVALRIDDAGSHDYPSRYNDERMIPPGPFRFSVGLKGLKTPSGRKLDPNRVTRIILFGWQGNPPVAITRFASARAATLPPGARGYAFGALDAAVPPGFERIDPSDPRLTGRGPIIAVQRPAPDPLVANGLKNVRRIVLPAPAPRVRVTVWSEDPGEWELLPHPFERRIQVNGSDLLVETLTADQWIANRYLRGAQAEHTAADDAWTAYGALRGNARSIDVDAGRDGVAIDLSGADASAYFVNAVLIEPVAAKPAAGSVAGPVTAGLAFADEQRAAWYRNRLPVAPPVEGGNDGAFAVPLVWSQPPSPLPAPLQARAAADTGVSLAMAVTSDVAIDHPRITVDAPRRGGIALGARLWAGQYKLERDDTVLRLRDNRLLANTSALPVTTARARTYELWIDVPKGTPPGVYAGAVAFGHGTLSRTVPIEITVMPVVLPPPSKPAGFYLARAAHLGYFAGLTIERERQVGCDLDLLRGFGLTNTAPPIGGLDRTDLGVFASDMRRAQRAGVSPGWLIYNPLNDLVASQGLGRAADTVGRLEVLIRAQGLPQPLWSVADEPSNPDQSAAQLGDWVNLLRARARGIRLAGHLNAAADERYAPLFDTLIINPAFGLDVPTLERLRKSGKGVWIYNTFAPRQTAGLWLWRTAAERYIQWHARLPTADPFDPIDGREADFQMIYPSAEVCPRQPDIHRDLLRMAEGVVDQRWLLWLDAQPTAAGKALREEIRSRYAGAFDDARLAPAAALNALRARIQDLAAR